MMEKKYSETEGRRKLKMSIVVTYLQVITFLLITGVHPWLLDNDCLQGFSKRWLGLGFTTFLYSAVVLQVYRPFSKNF